MKLFALPIWDMAENKQVFYIEKKINFVQEVKTFWAVLSQYLQAKKEPGFVAWHFSPQSWKPALTQVNPLSSPAIY